jgi:hypothetical protein
MVYSEISKLRVTLFWGVFALGDVLRPFMQAVLFELATFDNWKM